MKGEEKKGPGRPRKYATDAERKKAYRERKKEEQSKLESRAKRISELQGRIDKMESKILKSTYTDKKIPEEISDIHEQIKDRTRRYSPSELMDLEIQELKRIRDSIQTRYQRNYYSPLLAALESAIMPSVDREFDSRNIVTEDKSYDVLLAEKLAKTKDKSTPKTNVTTLEYIQKTKKTKVQQTVEDLSPKRSTMEKKIEDNLKHWQNLKNPYRTDQLLEVFQELFLLYSVEAELSRRERESAQELDIDRLEKRLEEIEGKMKAEKQHEEYVAFEKELKQAAVKKDEKKAKEKKDENKDKNK
ncbi:MAG: hypothetical protein HGN29_02265 [Asgard group archaeon]|nr:hypothetical protein [Asgard group archaeon]